MKLNVSKTDVEIFVSKTDVLISMAMVIFNFIVVDGRQHIPKKKRHFSQYLAKQRESLAKYTPVLIGKNFKPNFEFDTIYSF